MIRTILIASLLSAAPAMAQDAPLTAMTPDRIESYDFVRESADYIRREAMVPMRDGTRLFTVTVMRKGTKDAPILLTRTPYNAERNTSRSRSQKIEEILPVMDAEFVQDGYIRVYQDVRGLYKSEGDYVMNRPLSGPINPTGIDHATDAHDTIDWLIKNTPETNGRVGIIGSSYPGFTALMALINPHPALKAAVPQSPMVDGWMGDDWFHNGAFRTFAFDYILRQTTKKGSGNVPYTNPDQYQLYLDAGSTADFVKKWGLEASPTVQKMMAHPNYDQFWQEQALDKLLAKRKLTVPTMLIVGQWDQEDSYGAPAVYKALEPQDTNNDMLHFTIGPWRHSQVNAEGSHLGPLTFKGDTAREFRVSVMKPFLDEHLKSSAPKANTPPVITYATGADEWQTSQVWPMAPAKPLYLQRGGSLAFTKPASASETRYTSDPARPVPFVPVPHNGRDRTTWTTWLVTDQRFASTRPDVISFTTDTLEQAVHIAGQPMVDLYAATSGTNSDWVVKLIDVYPAEAGENAANAGMHLPIGIEIFRGRFVHSFETPAPLTPGKHENYKFGLPHVNHVFQPGHRIMVQIQSSLFPLYDRNPQSFVPNIFHAKPTDYKAATQSIAHSPDKPSAIWLPIVPD
ncbi:MAG: CocE/NonD family hydrolase [Polymorphobacter sp.]|uniref:CocE/NonD family hydrolase n=1 Tax=Polymorphobacter sp. TaxID=1909290 RepID=UPI003A892448